MSERRPGERRIDLPDSFDAGVYFIGRVRTPWRDRTECPKNSGESTAICTIQLDPRFAEGLGDVASCSHLIALYWMDRAPRDLIVQTPRHSGTPRGVFALRSPARPNPVALAVVELLEVDGCTLRVKGLDCLDGTPLIDLKPYFASTDSKPDAEVGWHRRARAAGDEGSGA